MTSDPTFTAAHAAHFRRMVALGWITVNPEAQGRIDQVLILADAIPTLLQSKALLQALTSQARSHLEVTRLRAALIKLTEESESFLDEVYDVDVGISGLRQATTAARQVLDAPPEHPLTKEAPISPVFEEHARFKAALREIAEHDPEIKGGAAAHEAYWNQSEIARTALEAPTS